MPSSAIPGISRPVRGSAAAAGAAAAGAGVGVRLGAVALGAEEPGGAWLSPGWLCVWAVWLFGAEVFAEDFDDDPLDPPAPNGSWYWSSPAPWAWAGTAGDRRGAAARRGGRSPPARPDRNG